MKIQNLNSTVNPFAGMSFANCSFNKTGMSQLIDIELGKRVKTIGFSFSEIIRNLTNVFFCGGDVIEDISTHIGEHLKMIPGNKVPSPDTILRGIKELVTANTSFKSTGGIDYNFNINTNLNSLNIKSLLLTQQPEPNNCYDFDYDNQVIANNKFEGIGASTRIKRFVFRFITVAGKWVYQGRQWVLKLYSKQPYGQLIP